MKASGWCLVRTQFVSLLVAVWYKRTVYVISKNFLFNLVGLTECQQKAYESTHPMRIGAFVPQCNEDGTYARVQCWGSTGYCWCASEDGTEWPGTRVRGQPKCNDNEGLLLL